MESFHQLSPESRVQGKGQESVGCFECVRKLEALGGKMQEAIQWELEY